MNKTISALLIAAAYAKTLPTSVFGIPILNTSKPFKQQISSWNAFGSYTDNTGWNMYGTLTITTQTSTSTPTILV